MLTWFIRLYAVLLIAVPASARTDELFKITDQSHVALGDGGDSFGMETPAATGEVVILLNPDGEDCTLRFPLRQGEAFRLFVRDGQDHTLACEISLSGTAEDQSATFSSRCSEADTAASRRCPIAD